MKTKDEVIDGFMERCGFFSDESSYNRVKSQLAGIWKNGFETGRNGAYQEGRLDAIDEVCGEENYKKNMKETYKVGYDEGFRAGRNPLSMEKACDYMEKALDMEQAYQRGYTDGKEAGSKVDSSVAYDMEKDGYQRGLNDAWEAARAIESHDWYSSGCHPAFMGMPSARSCFEKFSPLEAMNKLSGYENSKQDGVLEIGDEVEAWDTCAWIPFIVLSHSWDLVSGVNFDGRMYEYPDSACRKTGRHFDILSVLKNLEKGNDNAK